VSTRTIPYCPTTKTPSLCRLACSGCRFCGRHDELRAHRSLHLSLFLTPLHAAFGWQREAMSGTFALAAITVPRLSRNRAFTRSLCALADPLLQAQPRSSMSSKFDIKATFSTQGPRVGGAQGGRLAVGITAYAVDQLGDITLVNIDAKVGDSVAAGKSSAPSNPSRP